jgi:hypothetical protein
VLSKERLADQHACRNYLDEQRFLVDERLEMLDRFVQVAGVEQLATQVVVRAWVVSDRLAQMDDRFVVTAIDRQLGADHRVRDAGRPPRENRFRKQQPRRVLAIARVRQRRKRHTHGRQRERADVCEAASPGPEPERTRGDHCQHHQTDERQIHSALRADFGRDRHNRRRRGERQKKPESGESERRPSDHCGPSAGKEKQNERDVRQDVGQRQGSRPAVGQHERRRPVRTPQILRDHDALVQQVRPRADAGGEAGRMRARARRQQHRQHDPGCGEPAIQRPSFPHRVPERIEREDPVEEDHHHGRRDHRFLARHPGGARQHGERRPATRARGGERAQARIDREEVAQRHHRLGALGHVVDNLGIQRMELPHERRRECRGDGDRPDSRAKAR